MFFLPDSFFLLLLRELYGVVVNGLSRDLPPDDLDLLALGGLVAEALDKDRAAGGGVVRQSALHAGAEHAPRPTD